MTVYKETKDGVVPKKETPVVKQEVNKPFCGKVVEDQPTETKVDTDDS